MLLNAVNIPMTLPIDLSLRPILAAYSPIAECYTSSKTEPRNFWSHLRWQ